MCRLVAWIGNEILLDEVLVKPANSLIMQSLHARESNVRTNGDGFGLGWYVKTISDVPALFTSISPAWNDRNLLHLTSKIKSGCFFSHIRAASNGGVTNYNCHPFLYQKFMMMHNGEIHDFISIKRHLRHLLDDDIYNWIQGDTDSEHFFALFIQLSKGRDMSQLEVAGDVFQETINEITRLGKEYGSKGDSYYNICITDGERMLASRYCSNKKQKPETLHYFKGPFFHPTLHTQTQIPTESGVDCVLIASEILTQHQGTWHEVPANHLLMIDKNHDLHFRLLD